MAPAGEHHVNKKDLSERDICTKFITPALVCPSARQQAI
jgi:hypothetical protein